MSRRILRFPVGRQFREIVNDTHEWYVVTDARLRILVARRCGIDDISSRDIMEAFDELHHRFPEGGMRIYTLHSHPEGDTYVPSPTDMNTYILDKLDYLNRRPKFGFSEIGQGVISKHGIYIVKLPEKINKMNKIKKKMIPDRIITHSRDIYYRDTKWGSKHASKEFIKEKVSAVNKGFKKVLREEPDIRTKMVPRTHRFNVRTRR